MKYSEQQLKAINHINGPALVLAVPGSGKTTVLLQRTQKLLKEGINPKSILTMTFSKAQALDMERRHENKFFQTNLTFSTIHSFAYGIVRAKASKDGKRVNLIEGSENYNKYRLLESFFYQVNSTRATDEDLEDFFRVTGFLKNSLIDYKDYLKLYGRSVRNFEKIYSLYENFKSDHDLIDFDDMLVLALKILLEDKNILQGVQKRFKYIQIDEGQDSSPVQLRIISLVARPENNLFIVADDDQSIYGFRGADSKQLLSFKKNYPNAQIYLMENNYRSTRRIVDISNKLISNNQQRYRKKLETANDRGEKIEILKAKTSKIQTNFVIKEAKRLISQGENVAILYRNNLSAINIVNALEDSDSFYIRDAKLAFYQHFIIKDLINIYSFCKDTHDINSFERIYYKLDMYFKKDFIMQIKMMDPSYDVIKRLELCEGINSFYTEKIDLLVYYTSHISGMTFDKAINTIYFRMGYKDYLRELARRSKTPIVTFYRLIDTIFNIAEGLSSLKEFEDKLFSLKERQRSHSLNDAPLILSTVHGAKGLEFDNVFLIDLVEEEFPSAFSLKSDQDTGLLEEERRLFYVAITRAKKRLFLLSLKNLAKENCDQSSFIKEIVINKGKRT